MPSTTTIAESSHPVKFSLKRSDNCSKPNAKRVNFPIICDDDGDIMLPQFQGKHLVEIQELEIFDNDN